MTDVERKEEARGLKQWVPAFLKNWIRHRRKQRHLAERYRQIADSIRQDDLFVVGHPKSGNTWLTYMLVILVRDDRDREINLANIGRYAPTIHARDQVICEYEDMSSPRIFRNEGPRFAELYPCTIFIVRDPRSVLLSYYHHCVHDTGDSGWTIDSFVDEMLEHGCIPRLEPFQTRWDDRLEEWTGRAERQPVKIVRYEDLKTDRGAVLRDVAAFAGLSPTTELIEEAVQRGDFNSMRGEEKTVGAESYAGEKGARGFFVRKGKTDSWKEEMPAAVIEKIETAFRPGMKKLGYLD